MPIFRFTPHQFQTRWHGSRMHSSTLGTICSAHSGLIECAFWSGSRWFWCGTVMAIEKMIHRSFVPVGRWTTRTSAGVELAGPAPHVEVPSRPRDPPASRFEVIQRFVRKAGFSQAVEWVAAANLRRSTAALYQSEWTKFLGWCDQQGVDPCKAFSPQIAEFFLYLHQELCLSVPAVNGYRTALNHVFSLTGMDLAASNVVFWMFIVSRGCVCLRRYKFRTGTYLLFYSVCLGLLLSPWSWPLTNILPGSHPFYLLLCWPRGLVSCVAFHVHHSCTFSFLTDFLAKTQNPSVPDSRFEEFLVPSQDDFVGGNRDELLTLPHKGPS